ncbi:RagB/SusD family nutrient uptake outer membrane protein [Poritiphilus flavus]|uniref:RagB/SusD family nutrient uptake outer membrane protein n=1 Tax=Poritiphilus flavus TaxID=2697053 RepID=A0A6L9EE32_9FLAO|nr:RagB/SusD family nutrient uptake outer membrane protein [Poritiphilus flavus]NAS12967.1 RagB/SusD family nutrient uptake outer membrane protein [Poritiphilus flavus]
MLRIYKSLFLLFMAIIISSCSEDFLETTPTESIAAADALSTTANMKLILNGLHRQMFAQSPLPGGSNSRAGEHYFIPMFDVITGDLIHSAPGNGWMRGELQWTTHTDATSLSCEQLWYQRYHFIASANSIINKVAEDEPVVDEELSNILGQAYAYRAWSYYRLITAYAKGYLLTDPSSSPGVPIIMATEAPFESGPRSSVEEVYAQMEADIDQALKYFGNASAPDNKSHISINAAYGIKARIALSKGDWSTAAEAAEQARVGYPLLEESDWLSGFNTYDLSEVIWGGHVIDTETTYYRSYFYLISPTFNGSQNRGNPKLFNIERYNQIPDTDFRKQAVLPLAPNTNSAAANGQGGGYESDPNYDNSDDFWTAWSDVISTYGMTTAHNTHPYMHVKFLQKNPGTIDPDDVIYMRSAEMYLIEAEAKTMMGDISGAQEVLQEFGSSRDSAYDSSLFATQADLMEHIKFQRYVELYGEGFSYTDHIRWDEGIDLTGSGASEVYYQNGFMQERPSINDNWVFKIPQAEIDSNPNISESDQN